MGSLNDSIREYTNQLEKGHIQKAYKGIMTFMSDLKSYLESHNPDYSASALYFGYMDMTFFAFTPSVLKSRKLKIAIVYLHEECTFEIWLAGNNRQIQADYIAQLSQIDIGRFSLSQIQPGVDSIIASPMIEKPNFDDLTELKKIIEGKTIKFIMDMTDLVK
jgi:hypothetical protein